MRESISICLAECQKIQEEHENLAGDQNRQDRMKADFEKWLEEKA